MKNELDLCQAGYAQLDITPPLGTHLAGYPYVREAKGVKDPLYVRAIAFRQGEKTAVMLVCDLLGIYGMEALNWYKSLGKELGLEPGALFITCTHTHTGPVLGTERGGSAQYDAWLYRRLHDAAVMAMDDLKPVTDVLGVNTAAPLMTFVRRWILADGTERNNPPFATPEQRANLAAPASENDESMRVMRIQRQDAPELVLISFQVHSDCVSGEYISADFPAALCQKVEENRPNTRCVFLNGCEGQMVKTDRLGQRGYNFDKSWIGAMAYGRILADYALAGYDAAVSTKASGLSYGMKLVHAKTKRGLHTAEEAQSIIDAFAEKRYEEIAPDYRLAMYRMMQAKSVLEMELNAIDYYDMPVPAIAFCGLAFVGFSGEPFNEMGRAVRAESKFPVTNVCCQTNGSYGYLPVDFAFDQGGYEPHNTRLVRGTAEQLVEAAKQLLQDL